jgi:hypothetical protein
MSGIALASGRTSPGEKNVAQGRKIRIDTTVAKTNVHYPNCDLLVGSEDVFP